MLEPNDMIKRCANLKSKWNIRDKKIRDWYNLVLLNDDLAQEGMESVAANDPRTGFNLGRHLMITASRSHKISQENLSASEISAIGYLEDYNTRRWVEHDDRYRKAGKQGFIWQLASWLLVSGWYAVFSMVEENSIWSEVWQPSEVYPAYDDDGLVEVAHIYPITERALARKAKLMGWNIPTKTGNTVIYNHWGFDDNGDVANTIAMPGRYLKPPTVDANLTAINSLPVFIAPSGGLPDMGAVFGGSSSKWQEHYGEAIVATNEQLTKNYNKMLTYTQQLVRDTANPRWLELSNGDNGILKQEDMFKRGAIFRGAPGDIVQPIPTPPIPVELRQAVMDYQNQMQRGLFPWSVFGNVQQETSYLAMATIASSSLSVLSPYIGSLKGLMSDMNNYWYKMIDTNKLRPYKYKKPESTPENVEFETHIEVEIPGYLVQRATVGRMLNPEFKLPISVIMNRLFPEITNPTKAMAEIRKDTAMNHPKAIQADMILAYREQAKAMREADDTAGAELYEKVAQSIEQELLPQTQAQEAISTANQTGVANMGQPTMPNPQREVMPQREMRGV